MNGDALHFLHPRQTITFTSNRLPHWQQPGATYFVTFRLADSLPRCLLAGWAAERDQWLRCHPLPWSDGDARDYRQRFVGVIEHWLDAGQGDCRLANSQGAASVIETLRHFDGTRYTLIHAVGMPNHVHVLFALHPGFRLERVVHAWKLFSARRLNGLLGVTGAVWQKDYFDRLVRDRQDLSRCVRYLRRNPEAARLRPGTFALIETELSREIE